MIIRNICSRQVETSFVTVQIETVELLEDLDEVLQIEGLDSLVLGPQDLSGSMGRLGETTHPEVIEAMELVASKAKAAGKLIGSGLGADPAFAQVLMECGVQWMQAGNDFKYMIHGCEQAFGNIRRLPTTEAMAALNDSIER